MVKDMAIVTMEDEQELLVCDLSNSATFNDLE